MKKLFIPLLLLFVLLLSACGNNTDKETTDNKNTNNNKSKEMVTFQSENGPVKVPAHPERIVVLSVYADNVLALKGNIVGVSKWAKNNPLLEEKLKDAEVVTAQNLEKIIELNPDLIIGLSTTKNLDKLKQIAPTVTFTYGKLDYLEQHIAIGKLLNKEKQAKQWAKDFQQRAQKIGKKVRDKIGEDTTITVMEGFNKQMYIYGKNWGRGSEILYQEMKLEMPKKVKKTALKKGYHAISTEVISEYAGDYILFCKTPNADNSFTQTQTYQNIPAVKNNHVIEVNAKKFHFNGPISLEYQLDVLKKAFLGK